MICEDFDLPAGAAEALKFLPPHEHLVPKDGCVFAHLTDGSYALIGSFEDQAKFDLDGQLPEGEWGVELWVTQRDDLLITIARPLL